MKIKILFALLVVCSALPAASAWAITPEHGAEFVLEPSEPIVAEFPCEPLNGGLQVTYTVDFPTGWGWRNIGVTSLGNGACSATLHQFPPPDTARHWYAWRTRQCVYAGNCSDQNAVWGPIWEFSVEPPPKPPIQYPVSPAPIQAPPAVVVPADSVACRNATTVTRNLRERKQAARRAWQRATGKTRRIASRKLNHIAGTLRKSQTRRAKVC